MLPTESIRFFCLDRMWIDALVDGACSIGRFTEVDSKQDAKHVENGYFKTPHGQVTGVLVRSEVVSGWPGLLVDGHDATSSKPLGVLRMERLSPNVLARRFTGTQASLARSHERSRKPAPSHPTSTNESQTQGEPCQGPHARPCFPSGDGRASGS
jgi:hypothetical protein